jgi:defect-in-organelle-trafficking protein DotD
MPHIGKTLTILTSAVVAASLAGCATAPQPVGEPADAQATVDRQILAAAEKIQRAQAALYQAGALNEAVTPSTLDIKDDEQRLSLTWKGDAAELVQQLARDRGLNFATTGVRLPLPVSMTVKNEPFRSVLELLRAQVGYRASISQQADRLVVEYNRPLP